MYDCIFVIFCFYFIYYEVINYDNEGDYQIK